MKLHKEVHNQQKMYRIGYMVNGLSDFMCVKLNIISFDNGIVNRDLVMGVLLRKYPPQTKIILLSITEMG